VTLTGRQVLAGIVLFVVLAAIVAGVVMLGSPSEERARRLDRRLVEQLRDIKATVDYYYSGNGRLPASLQELAKEPEIRISKDAVPGGIYRYRVLGAGEYELCGTFERASEPQESSGVDVWQHPAGAHCFTLKVEKRSTQ
jgi:type II secretory pathway pseudopilin PulG